MSASPSRRQRRALDRRADRLVARIRGQLFEVANDVTAETAVIVAVEGAPPLIVRRDSIGAVFLAMGIHPVSATDALEALGAPRDPGLWPTLLVVGEFIQSTQMRVSPLVMGGAA